MENLDIALKIAALAALIIFIFLAVYASVSLAKVINYLKDTSESLNKLSKELTNSLKKFNDDIYQLKEKLIESLQNLDKAADNITHTTNNIQNNVDSLVRVFAPFEGLINTVFTKIAPPLLTSAQFVSAASKAFTTFSNLFLRGKKG
jgi:prefoldin subunit 5